MEIKGKLKQVHPIITRGEKNFESRRVWIETDTDGDHPQVIELQASGKKIGIFDGVAVGADVNCHINLRGREWVGTDGVTKVFNTLECWRVEAAGGVQDTPNNIGGAPKIEDTSSLPF